MAKQKIIISNIWDGISPSQYFAKEGSYLSGIGIDPDLPLSDGVGDKQTSGILRPSGYSTFSGTNINANPYWIITTPKNNNVYVYLNNGRLVSYDSNLSNETLVDTVPSSYGNGAVYYNNYIYLATGTDISRYGPLDGTPTLTNNVWTGSIFGNKPPLSNTSYPPIRGNGNIPNHAMHVHIDSKLYICDYDSTSSNSATRGRGLIHWIRTTFSGNEGAADDGSVYNALDLPVNFMPVDIESYGTDIVIAAIQSTNSNINQGRAALFFWDTINDSFYNHVWLPDPLVTALLNHNGLLYVFSGPVSFGTNVSNGYRISLYLGGQTLKQVYLSETGSPPLAGAVESSGNRIVWGTFDQIPTNTNPEYYAVVKALGSKRHDVPQGVHNIINSRASATLDDGIITSLKNVQQDSMSYPKFVVGWRSASGFGLDKQGTSYGIAVWRSKMFNIGQKFIIRSIRLQLGTGIGANMSIVPKIYLDDFSSSSTKGLIEINNTNYSNGQRHIQYYPDISGDHNFCLELRWAGTALLPVLFPIILEIETYGD